MKQRAAVHISIPDQRLVLRLRDGSERVYPVSTSRYGVGFREGSMKTPVGRFRIAEKIGGDAAANTVFKGRRPIADRATHDDADLILSRILWLDGTGKRNANTRARYIYIHGTNHEREIGRPASDGCVRMRNADVIEVFDLVDVGTPVTITRRPVARLASNRGRQTVAPRLTSACKTASNQLRKEAKY